MPVGYGVASWFKGFVCGNDLAPILTGVITFPGRNLTLNTLLDGNYIVMLLPGLYDVNYAAPGFESQYFTGIDVNEGDVITKDVKLKSLPTVQPVASGPGTTTDTTPTFTWTHHVNNTWYQSLLWDANGNEIHKEWHDAKNPRQVTMPVLAPGVYRFWVRSWNCDYPADNWSVKEFVTITA